ncbi:MAG: tetratricopeptide repeat protein [Bacteroidota bacterium]
MTSNDSNIEKIDAFLNGELSGEDLRNFELALEQNEELQDEVELHRDIQRVMADKDSLELKNQLIEIAKQPMEGSKMSVSRYLYLSIAATVVLFISLVFVLQNGSKTEEELFESYYMEYPVPGKLRGNNDVNTYDEAIRLYEEGKYLQSINAFQSEFSKDSTNHLVLIYLGNSYLKTQQWGSAIQTLEQIPENSRYVYDAYWFTALSKIREKQVDSAKQLLSKLIDANTIYTKKASTLLEELD